MIISVTGEIGTGKTFTLVKESIAFAEKRKKTLVFNFPIDEQALLDYCNYPLLRTKFLGYFRFELKKLTHILLDSLMRVFLRKRLKRFDYKICFPHVRSLIRNKQIYYKKPDFLDKFLVVPNSVSIFDEAGVYLNSRDFSKTPRQLLFGLATSRHIGIDFIYSAQFDEQIDKQLRLLTQKFVYCQSLAFWDKTLNAPKLRYKKVAWFTATQYHLWASNLKARNSYFRTRFIYSSIYEEGLLSTHDKMIFKIYNSFIDYTALE